MTKKDYIELKTNDPYRIIYKYYVEKFDSKKHNPFVGENEFFPYIQMKYDLNEVFFKVSNYYDNMYSVVTLFDKNGKVIKYF